MYYKMVVIANCKLTNRKSQKWLNFDVNSLNFLIFHVNIYLNIFILNQSCETLQKTIWSEKKARQFFYIMKFLTVTSGYVYEICRCVCL